MFGTVIGRTEVEPPVRRRRNAALDDAGVDAHTDLRARLAEEREEIALRASDIDHLRAVDVVPRGEIRREPARKGVEGG